MEPGDEPVLDEWNENDNPCRSNVMEWYEATDDPGIDESFDYVLKLFGGGHALANRRDGVWVQLGGRCLDPGRHFGHWMRLT